MHLLPHWNWPGKEGQEIDVRALSNCEEVELFLNGKSFGRQTMKRNSQLRWKVQYAPGTLSAKGFNKGQVVAETKIETTGAPAAVQLVPDRNSVHSNGRDISVLTVAVTDDQGRVVPTANAAVAFEIEGPGKIIGVGNGDPSCHEPDVYVSMIPIQTSDVGGWRWTKVADPYAKNLPETSAAFDDSSWDKTDVRAETGPMGLMGRGVFRTHFTVTAEQLAAPAIELWFGKIDGDGSIYLNGERIAPTGFIGAPTILSVKDRLHVGENVIAIPLATYSATGGISKGVMLRIPGEPTQPKWSRSTFNGYAQVIVQSAQGAGAIKVTAHAEGLKPGSAVIQVTDTADGKQIPTL